MNQSENFPSSAFGALELLRHHDGMTTDFSSNRLTKFFVIYILGLVLRFQFLLGGK